MGRYPDLALAARADDELPWLHQNIPLTRAIAAGLDDRVRGARVCLSIHLDIKIIPVVQALLDAGASVTVLAANPMTTRDEVAAHLARAGARVWARHGMGAAESEDALDWAIEQGFAYTSEMGADVTVRLLERHRERAGMVRAAMEATGTGILRVRALGLPFPVFNWNDLPLKEGIHNRHVVGLMIWHTFVATTMLTLYGRTVLVVGYGPVGRGIADYAHRLGAVVLVAELDPGRRVEAAYAGLRVVDLRDGLAEADVVVTATGREGALAEEEFARLRDGAMLLNAGHTSAEIDVPALRRHPIRPVRPHVEEVDLGGRRAYLLAGGSMFNLTAGFGDSYDSFDLTSALMLEGIAVVIERGASYPPGVHLLPAEVSSRVAALAAGRRR